MDKETLVAADLDTGDRLIEELEKAGYPAEAVFWLYDSDPGRWSLWVSTPRASLDLQGAYMAMRDIVAKLNAEIARIAATGCGQDRPNRCSMPRAPATQAEGR